MPEHVIAHYEILEHLGDGGMGVIYKARDTRLDRIVALKFLPPHLMGQDDANERFMLEAQTASSLNHPNVCTIHEIGRAEDGRQFIAMAYYEGETLRQRLGGGKIDRDQALRIVGQIAEGLASAHEKDIVHRDIKPENIMITARGHAVILDFGIAKLVNRTGITRAGFTIGTAGYMSPEQSVSSSTTPKTDVWSLGVLLYEMLMGEQPFAAEYEQAVIYNILNSEPRDLPRLRTLYGDAIADLVASCLSKDPDGRPDSSAVAEILADMGAGATTLRRHGSGRSKVRLSRKTLVAAGAVVAAAGVLLAWNWLFRHKGPASTGPVAVFAADVSAGSADDVAAVGFVEALTDEAIRLYQQGVLPRFVVPSSDLFRFGIRDGSAADSMLGIQDVVTVRIDSTSRGLYRMSMVLRNAVDGTPKDSVVGAYTNLRRAHDRGLEVLGRFLGAESMIISSIPPDVETSRFEEYVDLLGHIQRGDPETLDEAVALRDSIAASGAQFPQAYGALAEAYWVRYSQTKDLSSLNEIVQLAENGSARESAKFLTVLGQAYVALNQSQEGEEAFRSAAKVDSAYVPALVQLTRLLARAGRDREADSIYTKIVGIQPEYWLGHMRYGQFLYLNARYAEAAVQFQAVVDQAPGMSMGYAGLGAALWGLNDLNGAEAAFLRSPVRDFDVLSNLGTLSFYLDKYRDAVRYYEEALAINPDDERVLANLASVYYWLPNEEQNFKTSVHEALRRVEPLLNEHPDDLSLTARIANYYAMLDDTAAARDHLKPFVQGAPGHVDGQTAFSVAAAWEELGERERALMWIRSALQQKYARQAIERYPGIESLRTDPRYVAMVDSMTENP